MNNTHILSIVTSIFLALIICGSIYTIQLDANDQVLLPKTKSMSVYGNLTQYTLIYNCTTYMPPSTALTLSQANQPISDELAKEIAIKVFNMPNAEIIDGGIPGGIWVKDSAKILQFYGVNTILFGEDKIDPVIQTWDSQNILNTVEKLINSLNTYWKFETMANLRMTYIGPFWQRTTLSENGTIENVEIKSIGVFYRSSVEGIDIVGNGADFSLEVAEGRVISAELRMPIVQSTGRQAVTITPQEAVQYFYNGWSDAKTLGVSQKTGIIPKTGMCVIDNVKLVYLAKWSYRSLNESQLPLVYMITGKLIYTDPVTGNTTTHEFIDYQYATN
jgi:hypothetical protein